MNACRFHRLAFGGPDPQCRKCLKLVPKVTVIALIVDPEPAMRKVLDHIFPGDVWHYDQKDGGR